MPTTYDEAFDTITNMLIGAWPTVAADVMGDATPAPELRITGVEKGAIPETNFIRFTMKPVIERQSTLRDTADQRYTSVGLIIIQVFTPKSDVRCAEMLRKYSQVARDLFRGKTLDGCIWFRNVHIQSLDPEAKYQRANVMGTYEFDEVG